MNKIDKKKNEYKLLELETKGLKIPKIRVFIVHTEGTLKIHAPYYIFYRFDFPFKNLRIVMLFNDIR